MGGGGDAERMKTVMKKKNSWSRETVALVLIAKEQ